jgi:hypothetical protein
LSLGIKEFIHKKKKTKGKIIILNNIFLKSRYLFERKKLHILIIINILCILSFSVSIMP